MEQTLARMASTGGKDSEASGMSSTSRGVSQRPSTRSSRSGPPLSMPQLTDEYEVAEKLRRDFEKDKREAARKERERRMQEAAAKKAEEQDDPALEDGTEEDPSKHDVSDKVISKERKPDWKDEALQTIPSFSNVVERLITVDEWCASALRITEQFSGSEAMKVRALRDAVPIAELKSRDLDLTKFTVLSFLAKIIAIWEDTQGSGIIKAVMVRPHGQPWIEFRRDLIHWAAVHGVATNDVWLLSQMKANIEYQRDILSGTPVNSETWARVMDRTEGMYNHARQDVQGSSPGATVDTEEAIDAVKRGDRVPQRQHRFTSDGRPICDKCQQLGHTRKRGPLNKRKRQFRLVYSVANDDCEPLLVQASVCGQEINALLDSGAMENVIDVKVLRRANPDLHLSPFSKRLIGADKKPISVVGAASIPITITGQQEQIHCVAVRNLNTDLIIGLPGLRSLGVTVDFQKGEVTMGDRLICAVRVAEPSSQIGTIPHNIDEKLEPQKR